MSLRPAHGVDLATTLLRRVHLTGLCILSTLAAEPQARPDNNPGDQVVVLFNSDGGPDSKAIAQRYAQARRVPGTHVIGLSLPTAENLSRTDYRERLEIPLLKALEARNLLTFTNDTRSANGKKRGGAPRGIASAAIRYLVLCYGVPLRVLADPALVEETKEQLRPELKRNEAAVDSELALLPISESPHLLTGPFINPVYGATNAAAINPLHGVLMVARLDGPTPDIAMGLVDKALQAETNGLWGRAYFDTRGIQEGQYKLGDDWISTASEIVRRQGFETVVDKGSETFGAGYPMPQIALYAGWYDRNASGPFSLPKVEFMPGAIAYHLHSYSASPFRSLSEAWVGPLLAKGATATMGCVDEPYLQLTPDLSVFFSRVIAARWTFGEAAYACQQGLSWQNTVVGDPLYRPMGRDPQELHQELASRKSPLFAWSCLRFANVNLVLGTAPGDIAAWLASLPATQSSAVLLQKVGDLLILAGKVPEGTDRCLQALKCDPSPQQKIHLQLTLTKLLALLDRKEEALKMIQEFLAENPNHPARLDLYRRALPLAQELKQEDLARQCQAAIDQLAPPALPK